MLTAELENANNLKDVLEETVLRCFGIPDCDVEVHATDSGQFLPPTNTGNPDARDCEPQRILPQELLPLLLGFLSAYEICQLGIRAVSRFFSDPKAWISHLVKLVYIDSLPMSFDSEKSHPLIDWVETRMSEMNAEIGTQLEERPTSDVGLNCWMSSGLGRWHFYEPELVLHFVQVLLECRMHADSTAAVADNLDAVIYAIALIPTLSYTLGSQIAYGELELVRSTKMDEQSLGSMIGILGACQSSYHIGKDKDTLIEYAKTVFSLTDKTMVGDGLDVMEQMAGDIIGCDLDRLASFRWCAARLMRKCHNDDAWNQITREILDLLM